MSNKNATSIQDGQVVSLNYVLKLEDGEEIDWSEENEPLEFLQGAGQIIPGLEQALYGLKVGDSRKIVIPPEGAYGDYDPDNMEVLPRDVFPEDTELEEGLEITLQLEDTGEIVEAVVAEFDDEEVVLDLNHPLAGETLHFEVKIAGIRPATADELAHGHAHTSGQDH